jgi:hypothetical protein
LIMEYFISRSLHSLGRVVRDDLAFRYKDASMDKIDSMDFL